MTDNELDRDIFQEQLRRLDEMFPGIEILNNKQTCRAVNTTDKTLKKYYSKLNADKFASSLDAAGIKTVISDDPKTCLCNDAYWNALSRFEGRAIFIHIPTIRNADEAFLDKMRLDYSIYL